MSNKTRRCKLGIQEKHKGPKERKKERKKEKHELAGSTQTKLLFIIYLLFIFLINKSKTTIYFKAWSEDKLS